MLLINSAAYVNSDLQSEFGPLPPAFLPVGNKRLFEHQIQLLRQSFPNEQLALSLPDTFSMARNDESFLNSKGVTVITQPSSLSLAQSIHFSICALKDPAGPLRILHGDTFYFQEIPKDCNLIATSRVEIAEVYEIDRSPDSNAMIWSGYFAFKDCPLLKDLLNKPQTTFAAAVRHYDSEAPMSRFEMASWCDFGHVNSYFQSRGKLTTARAFNTLKISDGIVHKSGEPAAKINAERMWFETLPPTLRRFVPALLSHGEVGGKPYYETEYLPFPPLNEVFVHGQQPIFYWENVFVLFENYLQSCAAVPLSAQESDDVIRATNEMAGPKTEKRLAQYFLTSNSQELHLPLMFNGSWLPTLHQIIRDCHQIFAAGDPIPGVLHGDFCLSNILYDSRTNRIKIVDPRGTNYLNQPSLFGDLRYDFAKLAHSFLGLYDHLIAGSFRVRKELNFNSIEFTLEIFTSEQTSNLQRVFHERFLTQNGEQVIALTVLLFLSALPLHNDDPMRQDALFANALRLYKDFIVGAQVPCL